MAFPTSIDSFKTVAGTDPTNLSDASHDPLSAHLNQYSSSIVNTQSYILANGRGLANVGTDSGGVSNAYVVNLPTSLTSLLLGMELYVLPANVNTGACTINVNSLGPIPIVTPAGNALQGGEISRSGVLLIYDGTNFRIVGSCQFSHNQAGLGAVTSVECAGYTSIQGLWSWNSGSNVGVTLNHVSLGVPISVGLINLTGASSIFFVGCTTPTGANIANVFYVQPGNSGGGFGNLAPPSSSLTIVNGGIVFLTGGSVSSGAVIFTL